MSLQSTVGIARIGAKSLRATVPEGIVAFLELNEGDKLEWKMEIDAHTGERYTTVRKAKDLSSEADKIAKKYSRPKGKMKT